MEEDEKRVPDVEQASEESRTPVTGTGLRGSPLLSSLSFMSLSHAASLPVLRPRGSNA